MMDITFPVDELTVLRRGEGTTFYVQIRDQIAAVITRNQLPAGTRLPTEPVLCDRFQTSRMTIRAGIQELTSAGLVEPRHGLGVFVCERPTQTVPDAAAIQHWVRAVDEIIAVAPTEIQKQYRGIRGGLPTWARPTS